MWLAELRPGVLSFPEAMRLPGDQLNVLLDVYREVREEHRRAQRR